MVASRPISGYEEPQNPKLTSDLHFVLLLRIHTASSPQFPYVFTRAAKEQLQLHLDVWGEQIFSSEAKDLICLLSNDSNYCNELFWSGYN
jgi:hypothetical protein